MSLLKRNLIFAALLAFLLVGCKSGHKGQFDRLIVQLADADKVVDTQDWNKITEFLDANKVHFKDFYENGTLREQAVVDYINDFFAHRRPPKTITFEGVGSKPISFHFYLEQSGSMTPYDSPDGDGTFKAAITSMRNSLPADSKVHKIGEKGFTDFREIFDQLLNKCSDNDVCVLVTDMIYSVKDMQGVNPQKVFNDMQGMIDGVFKQRVEQRAMLVVKMSGSYNGVYYAYDNSVQQFSGRRPYYIIVVGSNANMRRVSQDKALRTFADFKHLKGYENMCLFQARPIYQPYYSLLLSNGEQRGRFRPERGQTDRITSLKDVEVDPNSGDIQLALAVDLSHMLIDDRYLTNPANYEISSRDNVKIKAIRPIRHDDEKPAEQKYLKNATHIFVLSMPQMSQNQEISIRLKDVLPDWVDRSSNDNDLHVDGSTTFGLRYLMNGIYDSYKRMSDGEPYYFELKINLDR